MLGNSAIAQLALCQFPNGATITPSTSPTALTGGWGAGGLLGYHKRPSDTFVRKLSDLDPPPADIGPQETNYQSDEQLAPEVREYFYPEAAARAQERWRLREEQRAAAYHVSRLENNARVKAAIVENQARARAQQIQDSINEALARAQRTEALQALRQKEKAERFPKFLGRVGGVAEQIRTRDPIRLRPDFDFLNRVSVKTEEIRMRLKGKSNHIRLSPDFVNRVSAKAEEIRMRLKEKR